MCRSRAKPQATSVAGELVRARIQLARVRAQSADTRVPGGRPRFGRIGGVFDVTPLGIGTETCTGDDGKGDADRSRAE